MVHPRALFRFPHEYRPAGADHFGLEQSLLQDDRVRPPRLDDHLRELGIVFHETGFGDPPRIPDPRDETAVESERGTTFYGQALALLENGAVWGWGRAADAGQVGDGTKEDKNTPVPVCAVGEVTAPCANHLLTYVRQLHGSDLLADDFSVLEVWL